MQPDGPINTSANSSGSKIGASPVSIASSAPSSTGRLSLSRQSSKRGIHGSIISNDAVKIALPIASSLSLSKNKTSSVRVHFPVPAPIPFAVGPVPVPVQSSVGLLAGAGLLAPAVMVPKINFPPSETNTKEQSRKLLANLTKNKKTSRTAQIPFMENAQLLEMSPYPSPKQPSNCPLLCCFYAEFDNKVGPKVCCQSPPNFMDQDINVSLQRMDQILEETFEQILAANKYSRAGSKHNYKQKNSRLKKSSNPSSIDHDPIKKKHNNNNEPNNGTAGTTATTEIGSSQHNSIFDSTSEYIITGNELTGNIISLSAHNMHILTRPTIISDERYERNALLFCVGFVLRRTEDHRPFRPILSKVAITLRSMEIESQFLSKNQTRQQLQPLLGRILVSLNSPNLECNVILKTNTLNLKLFKTPKLAACPVDDYAVPILLRKDWQVQMYDWDLAINWVVLHIDGATNARQLSKKAEVDMEMVRGCLRVLRHHGVIALTDMFFYSNKYECTNKAAAMLAGKENKLLQDAVEYIMKRPTGQQTSPFLTGTSSPKQMDSPVGQHNQNKTATQPKFAASRHEQYQDTPANLAAPCRREEQRELRLAIAELYCACNRNLSFGDMWITLATDRSGSASTTTEKSNNNNNRVDRHTATSFGGRRSSFTTPRERDFVVDSLGPDESNNNKDPDSALMTESLPSPRRDSYMDSWRRNIGRAQSTIDWKNVFQMIDHRRFTSFGLVYDLIKRVHGYPFLLETGSFFDGGGGGGGIYDHQGSSLSSNFGSLMSGEKQINAAVRSSQQLDNNSTTIESSNNFLVGGAFSRHRLRSNSHEEELRTARAVAGMMDGTHCDDEIVGIFQKSIDELIDLVQRVEKKKVMLIYSAELDHDYD